MGNGWLWAQTDYAVSMALTHQRKVHSVLEMKINRENSICPTPVGQVLKQEMKYDGISSIIW